MEEDFISELRQNERGDIGAGDFWKTLETEALAASINSALGTVRQDHRMNGPKTKAYRSGERLSLKGFPKISRADVAHFALVQLTDKTFLHKTAVVST